MYACLYVHAHTLQLHNLSQATAIPNYHHSLIWMSNALLNKAAQTQVSTNVSPSHKRIQ